MKLRLLEPWRSRLLWLSLAVNVFALAAFAAPHVWPRRASGPPGFEMMIERLAKRLDTTDAAAFRSAMAAERPSYDAGRQEVNAARHQLADRLTQEPFDPAAARAALGVMQERIQGAATRFNDALVRALGGMSPAGRAEVARFMDRGPR